MRVIVVNSLMVNFVMFCLKIVDKVWFFSKVKPLNCRLGNPWLLSIHAVWCFHAPSDRTNTILSASIDGRIVSFEALVSNFVKCRCGVQSFRSSLSLALSCSRIGLTLRLVSRPHFYQSFPAVWCLKGNCFLNLYEFFRLECIVPQIHFTVPLYFQVLWHFIS